MAGAPLELVEEAVLHRDAEADGAHLQPGGQGGSGLRPAAPSGTCAVSAARTTAPTPGALGSIVGSSCAMAVPGPPMTVSPARPATPSAAPACRPVRSICRRSSWCAPRFPRMLRPFRTSSAMLDLLDLRTAPRPDRFRPRSRPMRRGARSRRRRPSRRASVSPCWGARWRSKLSCCSIFTSPPVAQRERNRAQAPRVFDGADDRLQFVVRPAVPLPASAGGRRGRRS